MAEARSVEMSENELHEFLEHGGTGIVSFSAGMDEAPYSLPVSYGYDVPSEDFYFRFGFESGTSKESVVEEERPISFVTYGHTDSGWRSVVATGELEEVTEAEIGTQAAEAIRRIEIPLVDVFEHHPKELTFRFFRLLDADVSGRKEARTED